MGGFIFFLVCAVGLFFLARWLRQESTYEKHVTDGVIERKVFKEHGNVRFYVRCTINGQQVLKKTITYLKGTADLHEGDKVQVAYHYRKNGEMGVLVEVLDGNVVSVNTSNDKTIRGIVAVAIVFVLIAVVLLVKSLIK